ncbi:MAG: hypothetical protein CMJ83_00485 [Planctomycetes bacterium]|nr:hypothetical protein [Planctomycetota bacterium]
MMKALILCSTLVLALVPSAVGQVYAFHPQLNPFQGFGLNNYPFGPAASSGLTFVNHIPATVLDPANPLIRDLSLWTPFQGSWSANGFKLAIGHLANPSPCPFTFPSGPGGANIGSFTDLHVMWDSTADGPFSFPFSPDQWNPLGLAASGRLPFTWNGVDDLGVFIIHTGANIVGDSRMRSGPEVNRTYTGSVGGQCNALGGLWMRLHLGCPTQSWETNDLESSLDVNGLTSDGCGPITETSCVFSTDTWNVSSTSIGLPWDLGVTRNAGVPLGGGGIATPSGQIVNLDFTDPLLFFAFGLQLTNAFANISAPISYSTPIAWSMQMVNISPTNPDAIALSALTRFSAQDPAAPITFNLGLDGFRQVFVDEPPFCGQPINFYGTTYTSFFVNANGFVSFGAGESWWAADPSEWSLRMPRIGCWTDFDSQTTGTITSAAAGSQIIVSYQSIPENLGAGVTSFDVVFDTTVGSAAIGGYQINGLHLTSTLVGITPGNGALDPGSWTWNAFLGFPTQPGPGGNTMLYEMSPVNQPTGFTGIEFPNSDASAFRVF